MQTVKTKNSDKTILMGIDPGSAKTGYAVISVDGERGNRPAVIDYGVIRAPSRSDISVRLWKIFRELSSVMEQYAPDEVAVERAFHAKNVRSTLSLGEARGVALLAAASKNISLFEYSPLVIKKNIAGYGLADKKQVCFMVGKLLGIRSEEIPADASDALAVALCHSAHRNSPLCKSPEKR